VIFIIINYKISVLILLINGEKMVVQANADPLRNMCTSFYDLESDDDSSGSSLSSSSLSSSSLSSRSFNAATLEDFDQMEKRDFIRYVELVPQLDLQTSKSLNSNVTVGKSGALSPVAVKTYEFGKHFFIPKERDAYKILEKAPNCVRKREIGRFKNTLAISMNHAGEINLAEYVKDNSKEIGVGKLKLIGRQVFEFLEYAHARGYVHCDIKPENICMESSQATVIDLEFLCKIGNQTLDIGTPGYSHPELMLGCPVRDYFDLFSAASTILYICTGKSFSPNNGDKQLSKEVEKSISYFGEFNNFDENNKNLMVQTYIAMYEYKNFIGDEIFQQIIDSIIKNDGEKEFCDIIFQKDDHGNYKLRELANVNFPQINWNEELAKVSAIGDRDLVNLVPLIKGLALEGLNENPRSADDYLNGFFELNNMKFKLNINHKFLKKGYELKITDPENPSNYLTVNLDRDINDIRFEDYYLLNNEDGKYQIEISKKMSSKNDASKEIVFKREACEILNDEWLNIS
jgi:serine/threonine protein kinase